MANVRTTSVKINPIKTSDIRIVNMAAEVVEGGGQDDQAQKQHDEVKENMDITIIANRSELNTSLIGNNTEEIYKLGFSLNDLYKLSLQFYRKGEDLRLLLTHFNPMTHTHVL